MILKRIRILTYIPFMSLVFNGIFSHQRKIINNKKAQKRCVEQDYFSVDIFLKELSNLDGLLRPLLFFSRLCLLEMDLIFYNFPCKVLLRLKETNICIHFGYPYSKNLNFRIALHFFKVHIFLKSIFNAIKGLLITLVIRVVCL